MNKVKLKDTFCEKFTSILKEEINQDEIDLDKISEHINICSTCKTSILLFVKSYLNAGTLLKLLKGI